MGIGTKSALTKTRPATKEQKLRELVLYISEQCRGDQTFGATKQHKLLFYADFLAYLNFGEAITGQEYFRLPTGPALKRWLPLRDKMLADGDITIEKGEFHGFPQHRTIPLRKADVSVFTANEINLIKSIIEMHRGKTAAEISDESHEFIGWRLAQEQEIIPYSVVRLKQRKPSASELEHGKRLEKKAKEALARHGRKAA